MDTQDRGLGCVLSPDQSTPSVEPHLVGGPLPEQFIVPAWRGCFDADFKPIPDKIKARILDQGQQPSCVGHGTTVQKSAQEFTPEELQSMLKLISPRDIFRLAKKYDGQPDTWGTSLGAAQDGLVNDGAAEDTLVNRDPNMPQDVYRKEADLTPAVIENRKKHKGRSPFQVPRTLIRQTGVQYLLPIVTSLMWYAQDNRIGADGIMRMPTTSAVAGHCIAWIGYIFVIDMTSGSPVRVRVDVFVNSFGPSWGACGLFYVPEDGTINRFNNGYVTLDMPSDVAAIVAKYEGKDVIVAGKPEIYRIEGGKKRHYPNEIVWWASGRLFGVDIVNIDGVELDVLPVGAEVTIDEAPFKTRELVRQIRAFYGKA